MTPYQRLKRVQLEYKARQIIKKRKNDKNYQEMINRCIKEAQNPIYRILNRIRYKLGLLHIEGE